MRPIYAYDDARHRDEDYVPIDETLDDIPNPDEDADAAEARLALYHERIEPHLTSLAPTEQDIIDLLIFRRKTQSEVAAILGVTQAAISYRLQRAISKLQFLASVPILTEPQIRAALSPHIAPMDVEILVGMWRTTCQSEVAAQIGLSQGRVRHRFFSTLSRLQKLAQEDESIAPFHAYFRELSVRGKNTKHEVVLPQWQDRAHPPQARSIDRLSNDEVRRIRVNFADKTQTREEILAQHGISPQDLSALLGGYARRDAGGPLRQRTPRKRRNPKKTHIELEVVSK